MLVRKVGTNARLKLPGSPVLLRVVHFAVRVDPRSYPDRQVRQTYRASGKARYVAGHSPAPPLQPHRMTPCCPALSSKHFTAIMLTLLNIMASAWGSCRCGWSASIARQRLSSRLRFVLRRLFFNDFTFRIFAFFVRQEGRRASFLRVWYRLLNWIELHVALDVQCVESESFVLLLFNVLKSIVLTLKFDLMGCRHPRGSPPNYLLFLTPCLALAYPMPG